MAKRARKSSRRPTISRHSELSGTETGKAIERAMAKLKRMEAERRAADRRSQQLTFRIGVQRAELVKLLMGPSPTSPGGRDERSESGS